MVRSETLSALLSAACLVLAIALVFSFSASSALRGDRDAAEREAFMQSSLNQASSLLADRLWSISSEVMRASGDLRQVALDSDEAQAILAVLAGSDECIVNAVTMNTSGYIVNAWPASFDHVVSEYVGDHEATVEMVEHRKPVFSDVFTAVEGFEAAVIAYPVFDGEGRMVGSVTALFRTEDLMTGLFQGLSMDASQGVMVEQIDGRILYDKDASQIGRYTFDDPLYQQSPSLLELARLVSLQYSGSGEYAFSTEGGEVHKNAIWTSVTLHERSWRVLLYWEA